MDPTGGHVTSGRTGEAADKAMGAVQVSTVVLVRVCSQFTYTTAKFSVKIRSFLTKNRSCL